MYVRGDLMSDKLYKTLNKKQQAYVNFKIHNIKNGFT